MYSAILTLCFLFTSIYLPVNSEDPDETAPTGAVTSGYLYTMDRWVTSGRVTRTKHLNGPITSGAIHELLSELPWLTPYDRQMINQARCEVSREWNVFLKNATVKILLEDQDIVLISGSGTNKMIVQRDGRNDIHCDWEETGIGMKLRNGAKKVGKFLLSIFAGAVKAVSFFAPKAIGWF